MACQITRHQVSELTSSRLKGRLGQCGATILGTSLLFQNEGGRMQEYQFINLFLK